MGDFRIGILKEPLQISLLKALQVIVISRRLTPIRISTAVGEESAHLSRTTRLMQSRYWNKELAVLFNFSIELFVNFVVVDVEVVVEGIVVVVVVVFVVVVVVMVVGFG